MVYNKLRLNRFFRGVGPYATLPNKCTIQRSSRANPDNSCIHLDAKDTVKTYTGP